MNIKQKVFLLSAAFVLVAGLSLFINQSVMAQGNNGCETDTAIIACPDRDPAGDGIENSGIWSVLILIINILTGLVGVAALGGIIYGAILYTSAGGSVEQTKKAMGIITNVVIGIIAYGLMYVGLNFLIPGGVFN